MEAGLLTFKALYHFHGPLGPKVYYNDSGNIHLMAPFVPVPRYLHSFYYLLSIPGLPPCILLLTVSILKLTDVMP